MDPTIELCVAQSSFQERPHVQLQSQLIVSSSSQTALPKPGDVKILTFLKRLLSTLTTVVPDVVDVEAYSALQAAKNQFDRIKRVDLRNGRSEYFEALRSHANPFEGVGEVFIRRSGTKLANIDAIFNLTNTMSNHFAQNSEGTFTFCDIAGGPGAWSQYLQFRWPTSQGYGITLREDKNKGLNWSTRNLDMDRFVEYYGPEGSDLSGDLFVHAANFADFVKQKYTRGVDLVVCDGGLDDTGEEEFQETVNSRLIFSEIYSSLLCLKSGGHLVLKVYDLVTKFSIDFVRILYWCFDELHIFKPMSSRPANSERYIVGRRRKDNIDDAIGICRKVYSAFTKELMVKQIFEDVDSGLMPELERLNNLNLAHQTYYVNIILDLDNGTDITVPVYNLHRATSMWRLPDPEELYRAKPVSRVIKIFSELDFILRPNDPELVYQRRLQKTAVHWGQRKLLLTLVQFLTRFWDQKAHPKPLIVYAGAAPGENIEICSRMFTMAKFYLYDKNSKNPFQIKDSERIKIHEELFTDETAAFWATQESVFFISDIRVDGKNEGLIREEMDLQKGWYEIIKPVAAQLKFRLPYAPENSNTAVPFEYLNGYVFKQAWAPPGSTETRLVPFREKPSIVWDARKYESQMYYHNTVIREQQKFKNPFTGRNDDPIWEGHLENDYDSTCEALILKEYREKFGKLVTQSEVARMSQKITDELNQNKPRKVSLQSIRKEPHRFKKLSE